MRTDFLIQMINIHSQNIFWGICLTWEDILSFHPFYFSLGICV